MGSNRVHGYDNEKCEHAVTVAPFALDRLPVTAGQWVQFISQGGYNRPELWNPQGWEWRNREHVTLPEYWVRSGEGYALFSLAMGFDPFTRTSRSIA